MIELEEGEKLDL